MTPDKSTSFPHGPPLPRDRPVINIKPGEEFRREHLSHAKIDALRAAGEGWILPNEEREASRRAIMRRIRPHEDVWVFAYGSLMWNPIIKVAETRKAVIHGYHRRFCLWMPTARGTSDLPGLMLALDRGGACTGLVHRIAAHHVEAELDLLWLREMIGGHYRPRWVQARTPERTVPAITFVINRDHPQYAGRLSEKTIVHHLANAEGRIGTNRSYLYNTVRQLDALGLRDGPLHALERTVRSLAGDEPEHHSGRTGQ